MTHINVIPDTTRWKAGETVKLRSGADGYLGVIIHVLPRGMKMDDGSVMWMSHYVISVINPVEEYLDIRSEFTLGLTNP